MGPWKSGPTEVRQDASIVKKYRGTREQMCIVNIELSVLSHRHVGHGTLENMETSIRLPVVMDYNKPGSCSRPCGNT